MHCMQSVIYLVTIISFPLQLSLRSILHNSVVKRRINCAQIFLKINVHRIVPQKKAESGDHTWLFTFKQECDILF